MTAPDGRSTKLAHGVLSQTLSAMAETKATHVVFAMDSRTATFRKELIARFDETHPDQALGGYKSGRAETPDDYIAQLPLAGEAIVRMGWRWYRADGFEADDVLAALAAQAQERFDEVFIFTNDKDLLGCANERTTILAMPNSKTVIRYTPDAIQAKFGVRPDQIADWKALTGDSSDGYPGCPGIGPVGAVDLLARFGSVEGIYAHLGAISATATKAKLVAGEAKCRLSLELARLRLDLPVQLADEVSPAIPADRTTALAWIESLALFSIAGRLRKA